MKAIACFIFVVIAAVANAANSDIEEEQERIRMAIYRKFASESSEMASRLEAFIAQLVKDDAGYEHTPARRYAKHDLDRDGKDDIFLVTTFEPFTGGNYHESHFFAILTSKPKEVQHFVVGGRGKRVADDFIDSPEPFSLQFKVWAKTDAQCCPSLKSREQICIEKGRIVLKP
jgi:hypothetical protein